MKKLIAVIVLAIVAGCGGQARADVSQVFTNATGSKTVTTSWKGSGRVSVSGTFDNTTTGAVYIKVSSNGGATYDTFQGYSTVKSWYYQLDTTYGAPTGMQIQYTNKSKTVPRKKGNVWLNTRTW